MEQIFEKKLRNIGDFIETLAKTFEESSYEIQKQITRLLFRFIAPKFLRSTLQILMKRFLEDKNEHHANFFGKYVVKMCGKDKFALLESEDGSYEFPFLITKVYNQLLSSKRLRMKVLVLLEEHIEVTEIQREAQHLKAIEYLEKQLVLLRVKGLDEELNNLAVEVLRNCNETIEVIRNSGEAFDIESLRFVIILDIFAKTMPVDSGYKEKVETESNPISSFGLSRKQRKFFKRVTQSSKRFPKKPTRTFVSKWNRVF